MADTSKFRTANRAILLGNAVTKLKNQKTQFMELTSTQSEAIRYILKHYDEKELTAADLMENLQLSQSTVAGIIKRLEGKDLIFRSTAADDNRKSIISPTPKGIKLEEALKHTAAEIEELLLQGMDTAEQAEFNRLLQKALDNISLSAY